MNIKFECCGDVYFSITFSLHINVSSRVPKMINPLMFMSHNLPNYRLQTTIFFLCMDSELKKGGREKEIKEEVVGEWREEVRKADKENR